MRISQQTNNAKFFQRATFRQRLTARLVFLGIAVLFTPLYLAAAGKLDIERWLNPCGFRQKYNLPCPTCGMTASALAFVQGKILEAFYIQPAAALLCCALIITAFLAFLIAVFGVYFSFLNRFFAEVKIKQVILAAIVIILAAWALTLAQNSL